MCLPCADADFSVCIEDDGCFALEQGMLLKEGVGRLHIKATAVAQNEIEEWSDANEGDVEILDGKLKRLPSLTDDGRRAEFRTFLVKQYLEGQSILSSLHDNYPELFQEVSLCKNHRETQLIFECSTSSGQAADTLNQSLTRFKDELLKNVGGIQSYTVDNLAMEAVVDWLLRCPLRFPELVQ